MWMFVSYTSKKETSSNQYPLENVWSIKKIDLKMRIDLKKYTPTKNAIIVFCHNRSYFICVSVS